MPVDLVVRNEARKFAITGAVIAAMALLGQAAITRPIERDLPPKIAARVEFPQIAVRTPEAFAPRAEMTAAPLTALKAGIQWSALSSPAAPDIASLERTAEARPAARQKLASGAPLPPRRPANLAVFTKIEPEGTPVFVATAEQGASTGAFRLPMGEALMRRIGDVGSSIGNVGSSLRRMMHISSR